MLIGALIDSPGGQLKLLDYILVLLVGLVLLLTPLISAQVRLIDVRNLYYT